jgi:hypothetical protein
MFSRRSKSFPDKDPRREYIVALSTYLECTAATDADKKAKRRRTGVGGL